MLNELMEKDIRRADFDLDTPRLGDGSERAPKWFERNIHLTPLADLNERALHRYCTVHAAHTLLDELLSHEESETAAKWFHDEWGEEWVSLLVVGTEPIHFVIFRLLVGSIPRVKGVHLSGDSMYRIHSSRGVCKNWNTRNS